MLVHNLMSSPAPDCFLKAESASMTWNTRRMDNCSQQLDNTVMYQQRQVSLLLCVCTLTIIEQHVQA